MESAKRRCSAPALTLSRWRKKCPPTLAVVAGDDVAIHPRRLKLEIALDLRQQPAHDWSRTSSRTSGALTGTSRGVSAANRSTSWSCRRCRTGSRNPCRPAPRRTASGSRRARKRICAAQSAPARTSRSPRNPRRREGRAGCSGRSRHVLAEIPGDIGDRAQHRIEHDGARHVLRAKGAAHRAVIVGKEEQRVAADRSERGDIGGRGGEARRP